MHQNGTWHDSCREKMHHMSARHFWRELSKIFWRVNPLYHKIIIKVNYHSSEIKIRAAPCPPRNFTILFNTSQLPFVGKTWHENCTMQKSCQHKILARLLILPYFLYRCQLPFVGKTWHENCIVIFITWPKMTSVIFITWPKMTIFVTLCPNCHKLTIFVI